jgi:hypothetical protein
MIDTLAIPIVSITCWVKFIAAGPVIIIKNNNLLRKMMLCGGNYCGLLDYSSKYFIPLSPI